MITKISYRYDMSFFYQSDISINPICHFFLKSDISINPISPIITFSRLERHIYTVKGIFTSVPTQVKCRVLTTQELNQELYGGASLKLSIDECRSTLCSWMASLHAARSPQKCFFASLNAFVHSC